MVEEREARVLPEWKLAERQGFLNRLVESGARSLLELGAGPGVDAIFFRDHGIEPICVDLSPEMVAACRRKGLSAYEMDLADLAFDAASFDAAYALNCLLHVPNAELPAVLAGIEKVLKPGGLFYLGTYGGIDSEGEQASDTYEPKRFFSFRTDAQLRAAVSRVFDVVSFRRVEVGAKDPAFHFQSVVLRRPAIGVDNVPRGPEGENDGV
jgi:SAM-dependent methyltransferase